VTSPYATTGNGFDFLIDPYRFGGNPSAATSVPYPVLSEEVLDSRAEGAFDITLLQNLEEIDVTCVALSGTVRSILRVINSGPEEIDPTTPVIISSSFEQILIVVNSGPEEIDPSMAVALNGDMQRILIVINMETDSFNGVTAVATGGTMS